MYFLKNNLKILIQWSLLKKKIKSPHFFFFVEKKVSILTYSLNVLSKINYTGKDISLVFNCFRV